MKLLRVSLLTIAAAVLAAPAAAQASPVYVPDGKEGAHAKASAEPNGRRWPGRTITYHESPKDLGVRAAAKTWNRSGINIRFKRTSNRSRADVQVTISGSGCAGFAQLGYAPGFQARMVVGRCARYTQQQISAHEFGHILGLGHEQRQCALMNPVLFNGAPDQCEEPPADTYRCRIIQPHDLRRAARLYGGKPKVVKKVNCPLYKAPGALTSFTAIDQGYYVRTDYGVPAKPEPRKKTQMGGFAQPSWSLQFAHVAGECPADPATLFAGKPDEGPVYQFGESSFRQSEMLEGPQCVAMRLKDALGRTGPISSATVIPAPPEPPPEDPYYYEEPPPEDPYYYEEPPPEGEPPPAP